ncbi:hypothetical protein [Promicromonospora sp. NFX87]|jgi:hypothetical protein|uniref:hypothetical protein n=1 Tax=Promicromonospora sp. NFX87 TaxID=3402691 RepID=UPI003AFA273D
MATFTDRALVWLNDPATLGELLRGPDAPVFPHLERLVAAVYSPDGVQLDRVAGATVLDVDPMRPLAGADRLSLTWQRTQPGFELADLRGTLTRTGSEVWADLYAKVRLDLVAEVDPGGIESAVSTSIDNIASLADFRSRFRFLDLDDFLARMRISTVQELRESAEYVLTEVRLRPLPPFDPDDPANAGSVTVDLALAVLDQRDLAAGLRAARRLRAAGAAADPGRTDPVFGTARNPYALAVVLPTAAAGDPDDTAVDALFSAAGVLPLFADPP